MSRVRPRTLIIIPTVAVLGLAMAVGLYLFQPWNLFVDTTVNEASPLAGVAVVESTPSPSPAINDEQEAPASPAVAAAPVPAPSKGGKNPSKSAAVIATGEFIGHEHGTTGTASVIALSNGKRILRIENLDTSNGPDLKVWLSDADVIEGTDGWFVFDDGDYADLGALKGNKGSQNYEIPASVNLKNLTSVSVWCARFKVSFGAAELVPVGT